MTDKDKPKRPREETRIAVDGPQHRGTAGIPGAQGVTPKAKNKGR